MVIYRIMPDNKLLGPRFGARFPRVRDALQHSDPSSIVERVSAGLGVSINIDGEDIEIDPQEILIQTDPAAGLAVASDRMVTVAVDSQITPELRSEGLAREVVRRIQAMRKDAGFEISDRIHTYYQVSGDFSAAIYEWSEYIKAETLTSMLFEEQPPESAYSETQTVDGQQITLGVQRFQ